MHIRLRARILGNHGMCLAITVPYCMMLQCAAGKVETGSTFLPDGLVFLLEHNSLK